MIAIGDWGVFWGFRGRLLCLFVTRSVPFIVVSLVTGFRFLETVSETSLSLTRGFRDARSTGSWSK